MCGASNDARQQLIIEVERTTESTPPRVAEERHGAVWVVKHRLLPKAKLLEGILDEMIPTTVVLGIIP